MENYFRHGTKTFFCFVKNAGMQQCVYFTSTVIGLVIMYVEFVDCLVLDDETNKFICILSLCEWWIKCPVRT